MPRALTVDDATVLKLTLFALLERYSTFEQSDLDEMNAITPTPSGPADDVMEAVNRVRIDGKAVVRTEVTTEKGEAFYDLQYPFSEDDFPGGPRTVCLALSMRIHELIGMPVPEDERAKTTKEGIDKETINRLAASIEIVKRAETVN
ncbi:MAG: hypothetical protein OXG44_11195 [Gammaproteobacteria bacterium]|nr:hypothetical protein [Gammaproteobacteria bacterium]